MVFSPGLITLAGCNLDFDLSGFVPRIFDGPGEVPEVEDAATPAVAGLSFEACANTDGSAGCTQTKPAMINAGTIRRGYRFRPIALQPCCDSVF